ncbi:hypothetical protein K501DRAFT_274177 [Backusella circina FSU 941]|nr:hypothetical protein K501DRAFT_274177 [Backusella circina FSU 941]
MTTKITKALERAEYEGQLLICEVDESFTSKVCHLCLQQSNKKKKLKISSAIVLYPCGMCSSAKFVSIIGMGITILLAMSCLLVFSNMLAWRNLRYSPVLSHMGYCLLLRHCILLNHEITITTSMTLVMMILGRSLRCCTLPAVKLRLC